MRSGRESAAGAEHVGDYPPRGTERVLVRRWELREETATVIGEELFASEYAWALILVTLDGAPRTLRYLGITARARIGETLDTMEDDVRSSDDAPFPAAPPDPAVPLPTVSVVIPTTFERWPGLRRTVAGVLDQVHAPVEVLVIDNRPGSGSAERRAIIAEDPRVRVVPATKKGISAARNAGIAEATGEIIAFTDDDAAPDRAWTSELARAFAADERADIITGLGVPMELESGAQVMMEASGTVAERRFFPYFYERADLAEPTRLAKLARRFSVRRCSQGSEDVCHSIYRTGPFGMGMNLAMRRDLAGQVGLFDEHLGTGSPCRGGEDLEMMLRILDRGRRLRFHPSAYVWHSGRATPDQVEEQMESYGIGFGAAMASFVAHSPLQLLGLLLVSGSWARGALSRKSHTALGAPDSDFPSELTRLQTFGRLKGPLVYARTVLTS